MFDTSFIRFGCLKVKFFGDIPYFSANKSWAYLSSLGFFDGPICRRAYPQRGGGGGGYMRVRKRSVRRQTSLDRMKIFT